MNVIKLPELRKLTTFSNATIYRLMKQGAFPRQIKLSERSSVWSMEEIDNWFQEKMDTRESQL
jgi:prophage regulatory protein